MTGIKPVNTVVLVSPSIIFGKGKNFAYPLLGILYIAAFLQKNGIAVKIIDSFVNGYTLDELVEIILKENPSLVGFSAMSCQAKAVLEAAAELKKRCPSLKIAVGGPHISSTKDEIFNFSEDIDFLFYGEGEENFYKLAAGQPLEEINGLIYKNGNKIIINSPPQLIRELDDLPFPDLALLDIKKYDSYFAKSLPLASLMASRGCPYGCIFCDAHLTHGKILRLRTPENIVDEIENNHRKYGIKQFMFKDSDLTLNKNWVREICSEIDKRNIRITWTCNTRVDLVDEELFKTMKKSGCYMISFGIESGSQRILDVMRKGITLEQVERAISLCKKSGIEAMGYFMIGNPTETEDDARETIKFSQKLGLDLATFGTTAAYPGTELYKWAVENNALPDRFWYMKRVAVSSDAREASGNLNLKNFPPAKQTKLVKEANKGFYLRPAYLLKYLLKIRTYYDVERSVKSFCDLIKI
ncbi:MAG: radical SAM protein [Candidatus Nealsonbacteria bacterium]|nr:radical SAM protein [Candidatus Nealsonbacteria bacterium]